MAIDVVPTKSDPAVFWQGADQLRLKFGGVIALDKAADEDVALFESLGPTSELEIRAAVICSGASVQWLRDRDGEASGVIAIKTLSIVSAWPE